MVIKVDPDVEDIPFGKQIKKCFEEAQRLADETTKRQAEVEKAYTDACDAYLIGKSDVMRQKSDEFFKFFNEFFAQVVNVLPKVQAAPRGKPGAAGAKNPQ